MILIEIEGKTQSGNNPASVDHSDIGAFGRNYVVDIIR